VKKPWEWQFDRDLKTIKAKSSFGRRYIATMLQGGTGDQVYGIKEIDSDDKQIFDLGSVVVDRPMATIDRIVREEEVRQNIKVKILDHEAQKVQVIAK